MICVILLVLFLPLASAAGADLSDVDGADGKLTLTKSNDQNSQSNEKDSIDNNKNAVGISNLEDLVPTNEVDNTSKNKMLITPAQGTQTFSKVPSMFTPGIIILAIFMGVVVLLALIAVTSADGQVSLGVILHKPKWIEDGKKGMLIAGAAFLGMLAMYGTIIFLSYTKMG